MTARSTLARRANEGFHVIEITLERTASRNGDRILRLRDPSFERFGARHVTGFLELARVDTQITIGRLHQFLEVPKGQGLVHRQRAEYSQAQPLVNQSIER